MNIGIRLHDCAGDTLAARLASAKAQGFSCVHLALSKTVPGFSMQRAEELLTEDFAREVRGLLEDSGLKCAVLGCYLTLNTEDEAEWAWVKRCYATHLRFAPQIGALTVGTETPVNRGADWGSEAAMERLTGRVRELTAIAEDCGAVLALEPVYRHTLCTPERAERLLQAVPSEHLRIILDAVNLLSGRTCAQADAIIADAIRRLGPQVAVMHLKDYRPLEGSDDLDSIACGTGCMRYEELLRFNIARGLLPITLENTVPENAVQARQYLEAIAAAL